MENKSLKLCILTTSFPRWEGDFAAIFIYDLCKKLAEKEIKVMVVAPHEADIPQFEDFKGIEVHRFQYMWPPKMQKLAYGAGIPENLRASYFAKVQLSIFSWMFFIKGLKIAKKCDIIHAHWILPGFIGIFIKKLLRKPLVLTVHGSGLRNKNKMIISRTLSEADIIISPHPELTEASLKYVTEEKIVEIPNIINFEKFKEKSDSFLEKEFGLTNEKVVTFVGRLVEFYDPLTFIKAISYVLKENHDVKFFIVGDGPLRNKIESLIVQLNIGANVITTGFRNDVNMFLNRSDIFIGISPVENIWAMTILEAIVSGTPCILTDVGYTSKKFTHLEDAYLIPKKDEKRLAAAILELLGNDELRKGISKNANSLLEKEGFIGETPVRRTMQVYSNLIKKKLLRDY